MKRIYLVIGIATATVAILLSFSAHLNETSARNHLYEIPSPEYKWTQAAPPGSGTHQHEWKPGTYPSAIVPILGADSSLWMIGQKRSWSSKDGITWQAFNKHDWGERISMAPVFFNGTYWVSGGMEYATNTFLNEIWSSKDGKTWSLAVKQADWSPRKGHTVVEFKNKLWLFGGETSVDEHRAPDEFINDVWSSADGIRWTKVMDDAPWKERGNPQVIAFQEKLWLVGGQGFSDVWSSADGMGWTKVKDHCPWGERYDYGLLTFDGSMWVLGGRENNPRNAFNDVWFSPNGVNWIQQTKQAPWTRRSGGFSIALRDKLFLYGGKHTGHADGFSGDIWTMESVRTIDH